MVPGSLLDIISHAVLSDLLQYQVILCHVHGKIIYFFLTCTSIVNIPMLQDVFIVEVQNVIRFMYQTKPI